MNSGPKPKTAAAHPHEPPAEEPPPVQQRPPEFNSVQLLHKLYEVTELVTALYLADSGAAEYQLRWRLEAEPVEPLPQLRHRSDDAMSFSVGFDSEEDVLQIEVVFRKRLPEPVFEDLEDEYPEEEDGDGFDQAEG